MARSNSPRGMMDAVAGSMAHRTGREAEEWVALVGSSRVDPRDQKAVRLWLKAEYGLLQNSQWAIADAAARASGWKPPDLEEYIDQQSSGAKAALRPIFDRLRARIEGLGEDVTTEGRATYVPFVRRRQFALVMAATGTRIDVGLRFTNTLWSGLLKPAKTLGQATHKLSITSVEEISDEVEWLLGAAYDQNG